MSEDMTIGAEQWFRRGSDAMNAGQWDYAVECLSNAVRHSPESATYRQLKYRSCRKKHKVSGSRATISSVKLVDVKRRIVQARLQDNWKLVDKHAEEGIVTNPWDAQMFAYVGEACAELGYNEVARYAWTMALKLDKSNAAFNRAFGRFLCAEQDYDGARRCFQRILETEENNRYAREMLRYIDVEALINRGGYSSAGSTQDVRIPEQTESPAQVNGGTVLHAGSTFDLRDESAVTVPRSESQKLAALLKQARTLAEQRRWDQCVEAYRLAIELAPGDMGVQEMMEDAELGLMRENTDKLQRAAAREVGSQHLAAEALASERRLVEHRIAVFTRRAERYPSDLSLRFHMADDYSKLGLYQEAIPLFQQSSQNPKLRNESLIRLGQCWICDGKRDMARRQFDMALKSLNAVEQPDAWKTAHYWLGRICESDGDPDQAESHYAEVLLLDYRFRDTAARIDALNKGNGKANAH